MIEFLAWVEGWAPVAAIRTSPILYPLLNGSHILFLGLLFGAVAMMDWALIRGGMERYRDTAATALQAAMVGIIGAAATGLALYSVRATVYAENPAFLAKLGLLVLSGVNLWAFHAQSGHTWVRLYGVTSLTLWIGVIFAGRLIGFL